MPITGYGEDALCYWALSRRLHQIVGVDTAVVLYRPSFGRRGSTPEKPSPRPPGKLASTDSGPVPPAWRNARTAGCVSGAGVPFAFTSRYSEGPGSFFSNIAFLSSS